MDDQVDKVRMWRILERRIGIKMKSDDKELAGKALLKRVMHAWLPASDALLETIVFHLPSPLTAQIYRVKNLYEGPLGDSFANAIRNCDPQGPLMVYISKMIPSSEIGRFFAFGRVFAGTVSAGSKVWIMGPNYVPGNKNDLYMKSIHRTVIWTGKKQEPVDYVPCGNLVGLGGIEHFITKSATLAGDEHVKACPIRAMQFSVSPVVRIAVGCKNAADLPKLVEALKRLAKSDPLVACTVEETGEHTVAGAGELHLEICLKDLEEVFMRGTEITKSEPIVSYRETVRERSSRIVMSKSPNKHNRLYMEARPLEGAVVMALDDGRLGDLKDCSRILAEEYGWNRDVANKVWCFSPQEIGPNMVVDMRRGVRQLDEVKESVVAGFHSASTEGALSAEKMRGVCFELCDVALHSDAVRRGMGQVTLTVKRAMYAAQLTARPWFIEPIQLVEIQVPENAFGKVSDLLGQRKGAVEDVMILRHNVYNIKCTLPVAESFGFAEDLRAATLGEALHQCVFLR
ncbi:hypothetical protein C5167_027226 [Papaver somniferum]|nr:hypothetical protein C5167_027226 [Papaver somniferum]